MRPQNWQEMQEAIKKELLNKADELRERAEALESLANDNTILHWIASDRYQQDNDYGDLDDLKILTEAIWNWPDVTTAPGEGYW